jgi:outer membrane protein TolC
LSSRKASATAEEFGIKGNYFKQGILQKTDLLSVQVRVNEIKPIAICKSNVQNASDYLAFLLNEDLTGSVYKPAEGLENTITLQTINTSLPANRKDIQAMAQSTEAYQKMLQSSKMTFLPCLNVGSYGVRRYPFGTNAKEDSRSPIIMECI